MLFELLYIEGAHSELCKLIADALQMQNRYFCLHFFISVDKGKTWHLKATVFHENEVSNLGKKLGGLCFTLG